METLKGALVAAMVALASCAPEPAAPLPPNSFAFAVFGDGPYDFRERGRFGRVIDDVNRTDVAWFLHVGDIMWGRCSDEALASRLEELRRIRRPVIYTPGDNEWTDCHQRGGFPPLERLQRIRSTYFADPWRSIAGAMPVESQSASPKWKEFVENVRWRRGGFLFVTAHMVGSYNGTRRFPGRTAADDSAVVRRTAAALEWMDTAFVIAKTDSLFGVVIAIHADLHFEQRRAGDVFASFLATLSDLISAYAGQVLLIHGDTHEFTVDHPLKHPGTGAVFQNFTRLATFGSPDIGWVRVVIDSVAGRVVEIEPRLMRRGLLW